MIAGPLKAWIAAIAALAAGAGVAQAVPRIYTVAGTGKAGTLGLAGPPATDALFTGPRGVAATPDGSFLVADTGNDRIRRVNRRGVVTVVAGTTGPGPAADNVPATSAQVFDPAGIASLPDGGFLFAEPGKNRVRKVDAAGLISTVAGSGAAGFGGDGGGADIALLNNPTGVLALPDGGFLIVDTGNNRIRRVDAIGTITTIAGNGEAAFSGDGGPSVQAALNAPSAVALTPDGAVLIADTENRRIRRVGPEGFITTIVGGGRRRTAGPALGALIPPPAAIAVRADATLLIAAGDRVLRVGADGLIRRVAGGRTGALGDGGNPRLAGFVNLTAISVTADGGYLLADPTTHKIRLVLDAGGRPVRRLAANFRSDGYGAVAGEEVQIRVSSTRRARGRLVVAQRLRYRRALADGVVAFTIRAPRVPGRYRLRLVASASGQTVTDYALLRVLPAPPDDDRSP